MTLRSASFSLKYTENTPITEVWKVSLSVRRHCLSRPIERGNPWEKAVPVHRIGPCSMNKDKQMTIAECCEKVSHHEFQAARAEEERRIPHEELRRQQKDSREVHQQNLTEMEKLRKFQSSTFGTFTRKKFSEDQNAILELFGRLQEFHDEVNCMNDSKDFQDAESVRSGNSHVTSQPMLFPEQFAFEGLLRLLFVSPRRKEGPPCIWDTHGIPGNVLHIHKLLLQLRVLKN